VNERLGQAAEQRAGAEYELSGLGPLARSRRTELTHRIAELRTSEDQAHREASELAERAALLHQQTGPPEARRRLQTRSRAAEADYPHAHQSAQRRDRQAAELAQRHAARIAEQEQQHTQRLTELHAERQLREHLPEHLHHVEDTERATTLEPPLTGPEPAQIQAPTPPDVEHAPEQQPPQTGDRER
jgi:hypothetical protein